MLQHSNSVAIPCGAPILKCAGEPAPLLSTGKGFIHANGIATVTGDVHLCIRCRTFDCPQKEQMGNSVISHWCSKMSAAVRWLSLIKCLYSAGSHGTSVSAGVPGAAAARLQLTGASSGVPHLAGTSTDPAMSKQSICRHKPRRHGGRLGA